MDISVAHQVTVSSRGSESIWPMRSETYQALNGAKQLENPVRAIEKDINMDLKKIPAGDDPPSEINVVIEISQGNPPIKYEVDNTSGVLFVDRFLHTPMVYPANYGFIPQTLCDDGDP